MTIAPPAPLTRKAAPPDAHAVVSALSAAFHDDPVFRWVLPDDAHRGAAVHEFFAAVVAELAPHDDTWTTSAGVTGAALWVPHGREPVAPDRADAFAARLVGIAGPHADRMGAVMELLDTHHPHDPHEYLWFLGVAPAAQGRGIGSALLALVLERADRAGAPCYLEATTARNRALYERHGFVADAAIAVAGGPPIWAMYRS